MSDLLRLVNAPRLSDGRAEITRAANTAGDAHRQAVESLRCVTRLVQWIDRTNDPCMAVDDGS